MGKYSKFFLIFDFRIRFRFLKYVQVFGGMFR